MTKAEILEAINATIAPNGQKGITAESLANILAEIVNATPEGGSGDGSLYVYFTFPEDMGGVPLTEEQLAHNAEVYAKCLELHDKRLPLPVISVDASDMYSSMSGFEISFCTLSTESIFTLTEMVEGTGAKGLMLTSAFGDFYVAEDGSLLMGGE